MVTSSFTTHQIHGKGRGKFLGFPTINMQIPADLDLTEGIYAVWIHLGKARYMGALHYGPVPAFGEETKSLEVFLLDVSEKDIAPMNTSVIHVTPVKRLRPVRAFSSPEELIVQMHKDVDVVRKIFTK